MQMKWFKILFVLLFVPMMVFAGWINLPEEEKNTNLEKNVHQVESSGSSKEVVIDFINIIKKENSVIIVTWENPSDVHDFKLNIYRGNSAFDSEDKLGLDKIIKTLKNKTNAFRDEIKKPGTYYYAVTVVVDEKEYKTLLADQNYTTYGIKIEPKKELPSVSGLKGIVDENGKVHLSWNELSNTVTYNIYSSKSKIVQSQDLNKKLAVRKEGTAIIALPEEGEYYFAVTVDDGQQENKNIILGENSLDEPIVYKIKNKTVKTQHKIQSNSSIVKKKEKKTETNIIIKTNKNRKTDLIKTETTTEIKKNRKVSSRDYDYIILAIRRKYMNKKKYKIAIQRINELLVDTESPDKIKLEAKLMLGKIYYYQHKYKDAIKIFSHLKSFYPKESDFWIKRASEKL